MLRKGLIYIALLLTSAYTINAYWLGFNGFTTIEIYNRLPVFIAPASYVYLLFFLIIFVNFIYFLKFKDQNYSFVLRNNLQIALYICNSLVHMLVLYIWHEQQFMSATVLQGALVLLSFNLYLTYPLTKEQINYRTPIALFFSWQLFTFLLMMNITLVHYEWYGFGISNSLRTVIFLTLGSIVMLYFKYEYKDRISSLVFVWFYIGIAFANGFNALLVTTAAVFLSGVMLTGAWYINKKGESA